MFLNDFSVRIPEGNETPGGYVELTHNTQYTLNLVNRRNVRCDAHVEIDGKEVGKWRIDANGSIRLERPSHDTGHFTFYKVGTQEAQAAQLSEGSPNLGLVKVTFTPERYVKPLRPVNSLQFISKGHYPAEDFSDNDYPVYGASMAASSSLSDKPVTRSFNMASSRSAGGTGLSGASGQSFVTVAELDYDYSHQTVIHLRLVSRNGNEARPLTSTSTPVPPPVR